MKLENEFTVPVDIDTVYAALNDPEKVTPCFPGATLDSHDGDDFTGTVKVKLGPISMTYKGKGTFVERDATAHKVVVDAQGRDSRGNGTASAKATLTMVDDGGKTKVTVLTEMQVTGKPAQFGRGVMADVGDKILGQFAACLADEFGDAAAAPSVGGERSDGAGNADAPASGGNGAAAPAASAAAVGGGAPVTGPPAPTPVAAGSGAPTAAAMPTTVAAASAGTSGAKPGASVGGAAPARGPQAVPAQPRRQVEAIDLLDSSRDAVLKRLVPVAAGAGILAALIALIVVLRNRSS